MPLDLSSAPQAPPSRAGTTRTASTPRQTRANSKVSEREDALHGIVQLAGMGLIIAGQHADAGAVNLHGPGIAHEFAALSEKNEKIARGIDYITEAGPYAGVVMATMPLVLQLLANHKILRAEALTGAGVQSPDAIAATVKADLARQAHAAMQDQQAAERDLAALADAMRDNAENPNGTPPRARAAK